MKKKLIFIIDNDLYIRNYITTGVIKYLSKNYKLFIIANNNLINKHAINSLPHFIGFYKYSEKKIKIIKCILRQKLWEKRGKSKTIRFKIKYYLRFFKFFEEDININIFFKLPMLILLYCRNYLLYFYDTSFLFAYFRKYKENKLEINRDIVNFFSKINPDIVLYPNSGENIPQLCLQKLTKKFNTKFFLLVDNWDNLSSKSALTQDNNFYGVWGQQSKEHAIRIQGIKKNKVFNIGTPRFEKYFKMRNSKIKNLFNYKYILFLESSFRYKVETDLIPFINNILEKNKKFQNIKLIYRPHPWRPITKLLDLKELSNVVIDPQLLPFYKEKLRSLGLQPDLSYYPGLISNAEFVISGPTTMVIESLILNKSVLLLNFDDKCNFFNPKNIIKNSEHFNAIDKVNLIKMNNNKNQLEQDMISCMYSNKNFKKRDTDLQLNYYLFRSKKNYNERLKAIINKIL